jgi:Fe-S-cluster containining protein
MKKETMPNEVETLPDLKATCACCEACCCRQEAMLFNDTEVPDKFIEINTQGVMSMARLEDGWCSALDRHTMSCTIYEKRPWICREFEMGGDECIFARAAHL